MSSSNISHRMAVPPSRKVTAADCSSDAWARRINLAAGNPICLPSVNSMKTVRLVTQARVATNSNSFGLKIIVLLQKKCLVFKDQTFNLTNIDGTHAEKYRPPAHKITSVADFKRAWACGSDNAKVTHSASRFGVGSQFGTTLLAWAHAHHRIGL